MVPNLLENKQILILQHTGGSTEPYSVDKKWLPFPHLVRILCGKCTSAQSCDFKLRVRLANLVNQLAPQWWVPGGGCSTHLRRRPAGSFLRVFSAAFGPPSHVAPVGSLCPSGGGRYPGGPALPHSARSTRLFHPLTRGPRRSRKSADFGCLFLRAGGISEHVVGSGSNLHFDLSILILYCA